MMRICFLLVFWGICIFRSFAQLPTDFRSEQIFLGVEKTEWNIGDTIGVNGVVTCLAGDRYLPYSKYLYLELLDGTDSVLVRQKVECKDEGRFAASVSTAPVYAEGVFYLRGYTNLMRNFSGSGFAMQPLLIGKTFPARKRNISDSVRCEICPEGGFLLADRIQSVTAFVSDRLGDTLENASVWLVAENADTVSSGRTSASGLVSFSFIPQKDRRYELVVVNNRTEQRFAVPQARSTGVKLQCWFSGNGINFNIYNPQELGDGSRLFFYNRESGLCQIAGFKSSGVLRLGGKSGVTTLFLTDSLGNVLSQSTAVAKYAAVETAGHDIMVSVAGLRQLTDSIGNLYGSKALVRVVPCDNRWVGTAEGALRYESDFSSQLVFPVNFGRESVSGRSADLQAWLKTATFTRFNVGEAIAKGTAMYVYLPETSMCFTGKIKTEYKVPFVGGTLVAYNTETNNVYDTDIDRKGNFRMAVDAFKEGTTFFLQSIDKRGKVVSSIIDVDAVTFPAVFPHRVYELGDVEYVSSQASVNGTIKGIVLPDVVVKAKVRNDRQGMHKKFYENNYVDREKIEEHNYQNLLDILRAMPFVTLRKYYENEETVNVFESKWEIKSTRGESTLSGGSLALLLDGIRVEGYELDNLLNMSAFDIESVELLQAWEALPYVSGAINGAIMVTLRKSTSRKVRSKGIYYTPMGLSVADGGRKTEVEPGRYRLLVDVVSADGITSYERGVVVKE